MAAAFNRASWIDEYRSVDFIRVLGEGRKEGNKKKEKWGVVVVERLADWKRHSKKSPTRQLTLRLTISIKNMCTSTSIE